MVAIWYLIIITSYGGIEVAEFNSHQKCIEARQVIKAKIGPTRGNTDLICVEK